MTTPTFFHENHLNALVTEPKMYGLETRTAGTPIIESLGACMTVYKNADNKLVCAPAELSIKKDRDNNTLYFVVKTEYCFWEYKFGTLEDYIDFVEWDTVNTLPLPGLNVSNEMSIEEYKENQAKQVADNWGKSIEVPSRDILAIREKSYNSQQVYHQVRSEEIEKFGMTKEEWEDSI